MSHDPNDLSQFSMMDLFRMEADGQTQILTDGLLALERGGAAARIEPMMRAAHSIKGAAAIVGLDPVVQLAHAMEDAFIAAQNKLLELSAARVDLLLAGVDLIAQVAQQPESDVAAWLEQHAERIAALVDATGAIAQLQGAPGGAGAEDEDEMAAAMAAMTALDTSVQAAATEPAAEPAAEQAAAQAAVRAPLAQAARAQAHNFDRLLALASESRINAHQLHPFIAQLQRFKRNQGALFQAMEQLHDAILKDGDPGLIDKSTQTVQKAHPLKQFVLEHMADIESYERRLLVGSSSMVDEVLTLRMRPFHDGVQPFPRMVRDLARSLGKEAQLIISGEDTLVDRDILARIESPLNHMLRNAVDHGIETPAERAACQQEPARHDHARGAPPG
ncbi:Hpt domain-containing protein [Massilia sp. B-10]|nr:Hpt domain-containing protein [Massilia sp. B-10]